MIPAKRVTPAGITDAGYNVRRSRYISGHAGARRSRILSETVGPGTRTKNPAGPASRPKADFSGTQSSHHRPRADWQPPRPIGSVGKTNAVRILGRKLGWDPPRDDWETSGR